MGKRVRVLFVSTSTTLIFTIILISCIPRSRSAWWISPDYRRTIRMSCVSVGHEILWFNTIRYGYYFRTLLRDTIDVKNNPWHRHAYHQCEWFSLVVNNPRRWGHSRVEGDTEIKEWNLSRQMCYRTTRSKLHLDQTIRIGWVCI